MKMKNNILHKQEVNLPHFVKTKYVHVLQKKCKTCTIQSFYIFTLIRFALSFHFFYRLQYMISYDK